MSFLTMWMDRVVSVEARIMIRREIARLRWLDNTASHIACQHTTLQWEAVWQGLHHLVTWWPGAGVACLGWRCHQQCGAPRPGATLVHRQGAHCWCKGSGEINWARDLNTHVVQSASSSLFLRPVLLGLSWWEDNDPYFCYANQFVDV